MTKLRVNANTEEDWIFTQKELGNLEEWSIRNSMKLQKYEAKIRVLEN